PTPPRAAFRPDTGTEETQRSCLATFSPCAAQCCFGRVCSSRAAGDEDHRMAQHEVPQASDTARRPAGSGLRLGPPVVRVGRRDDIAVADRRSPFAETAQEARQRARTASFTDDVDQLELEGASELSELGRATARDVMRRTIERVERI